MSIYSTSGSTQINVWPVQQRRPRRRTRVTKIGNFNCRPSVILIVAHQINNLIILSKNTQSEVKCRILLTGGNSGKTTLVRLLLDYPRYVSPPEPTKLARCYSKSDKQLLCFIDGPFKLFMNDSKLSNQKLLSMKPGECDPEMRNGHLYETGPYAINSNICIIDTPDCETSDSWTQKSIESLLSSVVLVIHVMGDIGRSELSSPLLTNMKKLKCPILGIWNRCDLLRNQDPEEALNAIRENLNWGVTLGGERIFKNTFSISALESDVRYQILSLFLNKKFKRAPNAYST